MVKLLSGMRVVEGSAFVAAPLAGMTLAQMGADVIRFDRIQGGLDYRRWPVNADKHSFFWAGLNKGKRSIAIDMRNPEAMAIVADLICAPGPDAGIFLTNLGLRGPLAADALRAKRADVILMEIKGTRAGGPAVDYTVNPMVGFPDATGPAGSDEPVAHVLPAWDCITGQKAALGILAAERHRLRTGQGQHITLALKDVALAMLGNLGIIGEAAVTGADRPKVGNALYGAYGDMFKSAEGRRVMVVAITKRQWTSLCEATGTTDQMATLAQRLGRDFTDEGERFLARAEIGAVLAPWFAARTLTEIGAAMDQAGLPWAPFRSFKQALAEDPDLSTEHPLFSEIEQPDLGRYLVPGTPFDVDGLDREPPKRAPRLGEHTDEILAELGLSDGQIGTLHDKGVVAGPATTG